MAAEKAHRANKACPIELNTWVTVAAGHCRRDAKLTSKTPALVSAVDTEGKTVCVIYPCELVLRMGFGGSPLKRLTDVPVARVRPLPSVDASLAKVQALLVTAVRRAANKAMMQRQEASAAIGESPEALVRDWVNGFKHDLRPSSADVASSSVIGGMAKDKQDAEDDATEDADDQTRAPLMFPQPHYMTDELVTEQADVEPDLPYSSMPSTPTDGPRRGVSLHGLPTEDASRESVDKMPRGKALRLRSRSRSTPRAFRAMPATKREETVRARACLQPASGRRGVSRAKERCLGEKRDEVKFLAVRAASAAFGCGRVEFRPHMPRVELAEAMDGVSKEWDGAPVDSEWLLEQLEIWGKVFFADGLVFCLA